MYNGSSEGEGGHDGIPRKIPPAASMPWVRNLRRFVGNGAGLGSEALMGYFSYYHLSFQCSSPFFLSNFFLF